MQSISTCPCSPAPDRLLKEMNRHYNVAQYMDLIRYAKGKIPGVTFSSDIIVGFPRRDGGLCRNARPHP